MGISAVVYRVCRVCREEIIKEAVSILQCHLNSQMEEMLRMIQPQGRITMRKTIKMAVLNRVHGHGAVMRTENFHILSLPPCHLKRARTLCDKVYMCHPQTLPPVRY